MENSKNQEKSKTEPLKPKAFEKTLKNLVTLGIAPTSANQSCPVNGTNLFILVWIGSTVCSATVHLIYEAERFPERIQCIYTISAFLAVFLILPIVIVKHEQLFEFIKNIRDIIGTSK